jgi:hypothetical protein
MVNGEDFSDDRLWKFNDATVGDRKYVYWGKDDAVDGNQYTGTFNSKYIVMPRSVTVGIDVMESDVGGDDFMGSLSAVLSAGQTVIWNEAVTSNGDSRVTASITANSDY